MSNEHADVDGNAAEASSPETTLDGADSGAPTTLLNGLLGGVVAIVLAFIPFSPALGGGIAGYLEGGNSAAGAKVGAIAGLVALVPFVFLVGIVLFFVPIVAGTGIGVPIAIGLFVVFVFLLLAVYFVGLGLLGGVLGVYLREEV